MTLGKRIAQLRRKKNLRQEDLANALGVSTQAVSKWENDQSCPDISLLCDLARLLGISVDALLSGAQEEQPAVTLLTEDKRKDIKDMFLRIVINAEDGDCVRVNLPMALLEIALDIGMDLPQLSGNRALSGIDLRKILELVQQGVVGNLMDLEISDGTTVQIFVE